MEANSNMVDSLAWANKKRLQMEQENDSLNEPTHMFIPSILLFYV